MDHPHRFAPIGSTLKPGESQLAMNQNLTGAGVVFITDKIMILRKRSYRCPDAIEKMCTVVLPALAAAGACGSLPQKLRTQHTLW